MSTGNRCVIYDEIEGLSEARTVADLVRRLKPILAELAYYGVTGETAVLEAHEEWRSQYTDRLRDESTQPAQQAGGFGAHAAPTFTEAPRAPKQEQRPATRGPSRESFSTGGQPQESQVSRAAGRSSAGSHASSHAGSHASSQRSIRDGHRDANRDAHRGGDRDAHQVDDRDPMPMRANSGIYTPGKVNSAGVPRALLAIMSGTHPSLKD
jgi:hypothetical protein